MKLLGVIHFLVLVGASVAQWQLVWEDNFDFLDLSKWDHEVTAWGGGNQEFQVYTPDSANSYVRDGKLYIKPTFTVNNIDPTTGRPFGDAFLQNGELDLNRLYGRCTFDVDSGCYRRGRDIPPIMSARMRSFQRFSFQYGRAEIRAKMPVGDWMWPAMWLLPEDYSYGGWPMSGEIDIVEMIGNRDLKIMGSNEDAGIQRMGVAMHWGVDPGQNRYYLTTAYQRNPGRNYGDHFHTYAIEWDQEGILFFVDGVLVMRRPERPVSQTPGFSFYEFGKPWGGNNNPWRNASPMAPFDQKMHFLLNVAVGGANGYIPDNAVNRGDNSRFGKPWSNNQGQAEAMNNFWNARSRWDWTWQGETAAMQVDYVRVYSRT